MPKCNINLFSGAINSMISFYNTHNLNITTCITNGELKCLHQHIKVEVNINTNKNKDHTVEIECNICTIMELFRAVHSTYPLKHTLEQVVVDLMVFCVICINTTLPQIQSPPPNKRWGIISLYTAHSADQNTIGF